MFEVNSIKNSVGCHLVSLIKFSMRLEAWGTQLVGWLVGFYSMSTLIELFYIQVNLTNMVSNYTDIWF